MTTDELLAALAGAAGDHVLLWRGDDPAGRDLDLLVLPERAGAVAATLAGAGLRAEAAGGGRTVWTDPAGALVPVDVLDASAWAPYHPTLDSVRSRAVAGRGGVRVAAVEDRLLVLAGEAVAGRPVEKIARKARALLAQPGARSRVAAVGAAQGAADLAALISRPDELERLARGGRLPYGEAVRLAARSRLARAALSERVRGRAAALVRGEAGLPRASELAAELRARPARGGRRGLILAFSGMDGSGKSTLADTVRTHLEERGRPVELAWVRVASQGDALDRLAGLVKRLLRREGSTADPVAAGDLQAGGGGAAPPPRSGLVAWGWILLVAAFTGRGLRRAGRRRRAGATVMCDRWVTDALVDLELRYGRHRAADALVRALAPRADLAVLLEVDAGTAGARKPGDQAPAVLRRMEALYGEKARTSGATVLDARRAPGEVAREALALVDGLR